MVTSFKNGSLLAFAVTLAFAGTPTVTTWSDDGTFEEQPPWQIWAVEVGDGTGDWYHETTGGNPDDYIRNEIGFPTTQGSSGCAAVFGLDEDAVWTPNPAMSRPRVRFACDQQMHGDIFGHRLLIKQDGLYYVSDVMDVTGLDEWESDEFPALTQNDFDLVDEDDLEVHVNVHPDFGTADDVTFGFFLYGEKITFGATMKGHVWLDNWEVETYYVTPSGHQIAFQTTRRAKE